MKLIVPQSGVYHADQIADGNYAWIRHLPAPNLDWICTTATVTNGNLSEWSNLNYGRGKNSYEVIRKVLREAMATNPNNIILELLGDVHLHYMEKPLTDHFGADAFEVELAEDPVPFPITG